VTSFGSHILQFKAFKLCLTKLNYKMRSTIPENA